MFYDKETGLIGMTSLITEQDGRIAFSSQYLPSFVSPDEVVGLFHTHPVREDAGYTDKYPSNYLPTSLNGTEVSGMDWQTADIITGSGNVTYQDGNGNARSATGWRADASKFRHYIEGPDGVVREFSYAQRYFFANLTLEQRARGVGLPNGLVHNCPHDGAHQDIGPDTNFPVTWTYSGTMDGFFI
jgi:hypothetical protein